MASQKEEEPTASFLFGDSTGDDPFSQLQQQPPPKEEKPVATEKKVAGDASSLFGNSTAGADLFFSSTTATANTTPQSVHPPTTNASSFFDQPQATGSFFDGLSQQQPVSLTQAYDPTTYNQQQGTEAYDPNVYQQETEAQVYDQQQQQQHEWVEFDPNVHYYYDEQGGVHYYDPNTNQEYDMSQYGYDYQYDPQYAEYYSQQDYDANAYDQQQQAYDTNAYAPITQDQTENGYFDYSYQPQEVAPTHNAVAEVPAQVQSEQTLDIQQYQQGNEYGLQQQNYQSYEPVSTEIVSVDQYAPVEYNTQATDLQAQVPPLDIKDDGPSPSAPPQKAVVTPPPPPKASTVSPPPKASVISPPPRSSTMSPGAQISSHRGSFDVKSTSDMDQTPSKSVQEDLNDLDDLVFGGNKQPQVEDLDDLFEIDNKEDQKVPEMHPEADSILFGSELEQTSQEVVSKPKEQDHSTAYESMENKKEEQQVEQLEQPLKGEQPSQDNAQTEQHVTTFEESNHSGNFESQEASKEHQSATEYVSQEASNESTQILGFETQDYTSYEPVNQKDSQANYEPQEITSYESQQSTYEPQQMGSYEPQEATSYEPQQLANYEPQQTASYEPQQAASYEAYQTTGYEPQQSAYEPQQSAYEPQQSAYEPQQSTEYEPQPSSYQPSYAPISHHESQPAASREILPPPPTKYPSMPPAFHPAASVKSVSSPPPFSTMPSPRSNSITEPDRHQTTSPFRMIERSATVPPPMTERIASPRPQLVPCPDPVCEGENKVKAKFCCECGRPLAGISRSTTPSAATMSSYDVMTFTRPQDEKKEACKASLNQFLTTTADDVEERRRLALNYIQGRLSEFDESKALLWKSVELMIQHHEHTLGDGGQLDQSMIDLLSTHSSAAGTNNVDQLESMLKQGGRQGACQFAVEHDMWAHALIIASIDPDQFKHIIDQFIDRGLYASDVEWKPQMADNKKSLRMLYSVFNGTGAASVAQLVKDTVEQEPVYTQETLEGWKDALALILANRSTNDQEAIHGLGNQLKQAGLMNESQLCYLLSPDLLGLDTAWSTDLDSLYLYELYEFGLNSKTTIPQQFKLLLAWWLSDLGFNQESQKYVDSIVSVISVTDASTALQSFKELSAQDFPEIQHVLNKQTLDTLIASIENAFNNQGFYQSSSNQEYSSSSYQPVVEKAVNTPFGQQAKGIQSPFGGYTAPAESNGAWWSNPTDTAVDNNQPESYQPESYQPESYQPESYQPESYQPESYQPESYQPESYQPQSYQPDAYTPAPATSYQANNDDDDDLGFGNSKPKKVEETKPEEQKPNQITEEKEEKKAEEKPASGGSGWGLFSLFSRKEKDGDEKKPVKANLGEQSSFYYDEKEKRWVNKLNDSKPAAATPPPPPKSTTPQPATNAPPSLSAIKPNSMPPSRINSAPPPTAAPSLGGPSPAGFSTPPPTGGRRAGGARKPMRSRYVDVLNPPS